MVTQLISCMVTITTISSHLMLKINKCYDNVMYQNFFACLLKSPAYRRILSKIISKKNKCVSLCVEFSNSLQSSSKQQMVCSVRSKVRSEMFVLYIARYKTYCWSSQFVTVNEIWFKARNNFYAVTTISLYLRLTLS